jgi:hypothetical protein
MKHTTETEDFVLATEDGKQFVQVKRGAWNDTPYIELTTEFARATPMKSESVFRTHSITIKDYCGATRRIPIKITRVVEVMTEELNFNLPPEDGHG